MTYGELHKAIYINNLIKDAGFKIELSRCGRIALTADVNHENNKAFGFIEDNQLATFETVEEVCAFISGWQECKSMMKLSGQTK
jgi:hypothetical protein